MACKDEHCGFSTTVSAEQPHMGQFWMRLDERERGDDSRKIKTVCVPTPCSHCHDPACAKTAKNGAAYTRPDGIVIIDPQKAAGQKEIADACPIGAVYWNDELEIPQKCTMCAHILDDPDYMVADPGDKKPRCVEACPNNALVFGDLDDPESAICKRIAKEKVTQLKPLSDTETNVVHVNIPTVFLAGTVYLPDDEVCDGAEVTLICGVNNDRRTVKTNYFGDWEQDDLIIDSDYEITIEYPGYKTINLAAKTDTDRFIGEFILEK